MTMNEYIEKYNWISLVIVILLSFMLANPLFFKNTVDQKTPQGFLAGDAYWGIPYFPYVLDKGNDNSQPSFLLGYTDQKIQPIVDPPMLYYVGAMFYWIFGLPYFLTPAFLLFTMLIASMCALYYVSDKISRLLPWVVLPVVLLELLFPFHSGISWGFYKSFLASNIFIFSMIYLLSVELDWKHSIVIGILFSIVFTTHPSVGSVFFLCLLLFMAYEIVFERRFKNWRYLINYAVIFAVALILSINYAIDMLVSFGIGSDFAGRTMQSGYTMWAANPYHQHLGIFFWLAIAGAIVALLVLIFAKSPHKKKLFMFLSLFIIFFGPSFGFDRILQLRLIWPFGISLFVGLLFYVIYTSILKGSGHSSFSFIFPLLFIIMSLYIFLPEYQKLSVITPDTTYSIIDATYWEAMTVVADTPGETVLLIDPMLSQHATILSTGKYTRYLFQDDSLNNRSVLNSTSVFCQYPEAIRTSFFGSMKFNDSMKVGRCQFGEYPLCAYDIILLHAKAQTEQQVGWMREQMQLIENSLNVTLIFNKDNNFIFKNMGVCAYEN